MSFQDNNYYPKSTYLFIPIFIVFYYRFSIVSFKINVTVQFFLPDTFELTTSHVNEA